MPDPSTPPPSVPYLAYKSKRHSRNLSSSTTLFSPNQSPPPISNPPSLNGSSSRNDPESPSMRPTETRHLPPALTLSSETNGTPTLQVFPSNGEDGRHGHKPSLDSPSTDPMTPTSPEGSKTNGKAPEKRQKKTTFRRVPLKSNPVLSPSTLAQPGHARAASVMSLPATPSEAQSSAPPTPAVSPFRELSPLPSSSLQIPDSRPQTASSSRAPSIPSKPQSSAGSSTSSPAPREDALSPRKLPPPRAAPYPVGFQPKGVYRPLTDEFLSLRRTFQDSPAEGMARVERTKLERRLEKLIALHFPLDSGNEPKTRERKTSFDRRRLSSLFELRKLGSGEAGDLWRGAVMGGFDSSKMEVRNAEQRITPWEEDASVAKCPLCTASFHPLTNRKHHCRLCGRIICALPVKNPQRPALCSVLFVVDSTTRLIEEVGEGVDYGVKKRQVQSSPQDKGPPDDPEKFLRGVRVCRDCRPILLRQQYLQQAHIHPPFVTLYQQLIHLEEEIEGALPKFQELLLTLNHDNVPTKEASAARKRLLDAFGQYDRLSKKIRALPCPNGPGSSQDRVQQAVLTRTNNFLQKNMFPLQSLPTPSRGKESSPSTPGGVGESESNIILDLDAELAQALQPLLEQEALLETFIEEAQTQRKFEDVKALKSNLVEIRKEIDKLLNQGGVA